MAPSTAVCGGLALPVRGAPCHRRAVAIRSPFAGQAIAAPRPVARVVRNVTVRASYETEKTEVDVDQILKDLQEKWDKVDNKTSVVVYGAGAIVLVWLSSTIVGAVNAVPLLPKLLELVGLGYSAWFVYRYLLFKSSRQELLADVEELKKRVTGAVEERTAGGSSAPTNNSSLTTSTTPTTATGPSSTKPGGEKGFFE